MLDRPYLPRMALLPRPASPLRAVRDLRLFLASRQKHELIFAFLSVMLTVGLIAGFYVDSKFEKPWKRDIQYVQSWPADRSDQEIRAQQLVDQRAKDAREAELEARKAKDRAAFQRLDKQLDDMGL